jgi:ParB/RepB/Spo0J family partition protein
MRDETPAAAAIPIEASEIPLDDVVDSPLRKRHVPGDLEELAASIRSRGVLQPILVRPRRGRWEIVCGHRRVHAARLAGLALIPVVIRDMSDDEVLAAFLVAKCQRKDIHPIDEGDGYYELRTVHGWTVSRIAQEVGKASSTVLSRLKLRDLAPGPWEAYIDGRLSGAIALFIARIPAPDLQEKATREVVGSGAEPMSARDATEHLRRNYMFTAVGPEMKPGDIFDCGPLTCRLTAAACVTRQDARTKAGNPVHSPCGGGKCAQGADVRAALGGFKAPTVPRGPLFRRGLPPPLASVRPRRPDDRLRAPAGELEPALRGEPDHVVLRGERAGGVAHPVMLAVPDHLALHREAGDLDGEPEGLLHVPAAEADERAARAEDAPRVAEPPDEGLVVVHDRAVSARLRAEGDAVGRVGDDGVDAGVGEAAEHVEAVGLLEAPGRDGEERSRHARETPHAGSGSIGRRNAKRPDLSAGASRRSEAGGGG